MRINKKIIVIILLICIALILFRTIFNSNNNIKHSTVNLTEINSLEDLANKEIRNAFAEIEKKYKAAYQKNNIYSRSDYYNGEKISENMSNGKLEYVTLADINIERAYSKEGKKLEEIPTIDKELTKSDETFNAGNFLVRYIPFDNSYSLYYIVVIDNKGIDELEYLFYTDGEMFDKVNFEEDIDELEQNIVYMENNNLYNE